MRPTSLRFRSVLSGVLATALAVNVTCSAAADSFIDKQVSKETGGLSDWSAHGSGSFPSGHVAFTTALVTPFVLEYASERPWVTALLLLPAYEMVARVKAREHWQTDVLAGALLSYSKAL